MIVAGGSRGDVQPMVALGRALAATGAEVTLCAAPDFADLAARHDLAFLGLGMPMATLIETDEAKAWLGHSSHNPWVELRNLTRMIDYATRAQGDLALELAGRADLFIGGILTADVIDALSGARGGRQVIAMLAPMLPSRAGSVCLHPPRPRSVSVLNLLASRITLLLAGRTMRSPGDRARRSLGLSAHGARGVARVWQRTPSLLGASRLVCPPPRDWPHHTQATGYWFLDEGDQVDQRVQDFLKAGEPPVYVGFGSMSTRDPAATSGLIASAFERAGCRGVVHRGSAGLDTDAFPAEVLVVDDVPHGSLFPRLAGVIHHGGAGTTAAALRAGTPTGAVPHIGDQPYWGRRLHELGVGPPPVARHALDAERLGGMIAALAENERYRAAAGELAKGLAAEDGLATAVTALSRLAPA